MVPQQAVLEGWLRFNDEDVAMNRDGRLSPRQRRGLLWSAAWRLVIGPAVAVGSALIATLAVDTAIAVVLTLLALMLGLGLSWTGFAYMVDATSSSVAFVTAPLTTRVVRGRYTNYYANIGPISKNIKYKAYLGLMPATGRSFHLYYAPGCRVLLSMEAASAAEPLPAHPFGPESAHAWDRLRWSWILLTVGTFGALLGAHLIAAAHPAVPVKIVGTVQNYVETTTTGRGGHTERSLYVAGDGNTYVPDDETAYTPEAPDFYSLIGKDVVLYVNQGTTDVIAMSYGGTTYAADWYQHPEHQTQFLLTNGIIVTAVGVVLLGFGAWLMLRDRRRAETIPGRPAAYVPPTVQPLTAMWAGIGILVFVLVFIGIAIASSK